ncbi:malonic semialdehyde reductase [soil metagenome]
MSIDTPVPTLPKLDEAAKALLFTDAHTASKFADTPITDDELRSIWELAKWAPTQANFQPLRIVFVQSPEGRARLVEHMMDGNKEKTLAAPAVAILAQDNQFQQHIPTVMPPMEKLVDVFAANDEMRLGAARFNSAMQSGYFIIAARAIGLAAGPMGGFDVAKVDEEFFPDGRFSAVLVVNLGHPVEDSFRPRMPRLAHEDVLDIV